MLGKKIELRQQLDVGDLVTTYFNFLKQNFKNYTNIFINYNGIFILLFLGISYLLITGFVGLVNDDFSNTTSELEYTMYLVAGGILFFIVIIIVAALNYSISSAYLSTYVSQDKVNVSKEPVWKIVKNNSSNIIIFILLLFVFYIIYFIFSFILAIIPFIGAIAQYMLNFAMSAWLGIAFMVMLHEKKDVSSSFKEGWQLVIKHFWKCVGVNFIISLLNVILLFLVLSIPGILIGIYSFHAIENDADIANSVVAKIVWIIALWLFLIAMTYLQGLSQFINGILYFSLHEQTYNENTRAKIEQIGNEN